MEGALEFRDLKGETLVKAPGTVNGEGFVIRGLQDCSVFVLDYSSEVEVSDCVNCQIFIGPVDGPAIFSGCSNCQVAVACQQFQAKACERIEFGLYCATQPSLSGCRDIRIGVWRGAYPGLAAHFGAANLDPSANHWSKVYDASEGAEEGGGGAAAGAEGGPNFSLVEGGGWWEVPLEGAGPCENPVPGPGGAAYAPAAAAAAPAEAEAPPLGAADLAAAPAAENGHHQGPHDEDLFGGGGAAAAAAVAAPAVPSGMLDPPAAGEHPRVADAKAALQARLAEQARAEGEGKAALSAAAAQYLETFYQKRTAARDERIRAGRAALEGKAGPEAGPQGANEWERTVSMIDFALARPSGADLARFKSVLLARKAAAAGGGGSAASA